MNIVLNILLGVIIVTLGCYVMSYNPIELGIILFVGGFALIIYTLVKVNWKIESQQDHRIAKDLVNEAIYMFGDNKYSEEYLEIIANKKGLEFPDYAVAIWEEWETYHEIKNSMIEMHNRSQT